jgi:nucleotide-binding universal stress UspA family protein
MQDSKSAILVPLDGSPLAEQALPYAAWLGRALPAELVLARILPLEVWAYFPPAAPETYQQLMNDEERFARDYLARIADPLRQQGLTVQTRIERGEPATMLLDLAPAAHAGLIVMTTHGRTGLNRFALGSVADRLVHYGHVPIVLLRSGVAESQPTPPDRALVPLDGSPLAEAVLDQVARMAGRSVQSFTLVRVTSPGNSIVERDAARTYLEQVQRRLQERIADRAVTIQTQILIGSPAEQILSQAARDRALIMLATHGRAGLENWFLGSVADQVIHEATVPVLVVHPASTTR